MQVKAWSNSLSFAWEADDNALFVVAGVRDGRVVLTADFQGNAPWEDTIGELAQFGVNCAANAVSEAHEKRKKN